MGAGKGFDQARMLKQRRGRLCRCAWQNLCCDSPSSRPDWYEVHSLPRSPETGERSRQDCLIVALPSGTGRPAIVTIATEDDQRIAQKVISMPGLQAHRRVLPKELDRHLTR